MDNQFQRDIIVSHNIVNYLFAGYQGEYVSTNILKEFGDPDATAEKLAQYGEALTKIAKWNDGLKAGDCLFATQWKEPQTFESRKALEWLGALKPAIYQAATDVKVGLQESFEGDLTQPMIKMLAGYTRFAYAAKFYNEGLVFGAELVGRTDVAQSLAAQVKQANAEMQHANFYVQVFKQTAPAKIDPKLKDAIRFDAKRAPGVLRAQVHDINQLMATYRVGSLWEKLDFTNAEAEMWKAVNAGPGEAGYWRAFEIGPQEALDWARVGMRTPGIVATWRMSGFSPIQAAEWNKAGIAPMIARRWLDAGHKVNEALSYMGRGIFDPEQLPKGQ